MQIILKHLNAEEAWQYILRQYNMYQSRLKKFNYSPNGFMPMHQKMCEMFQQPKLSDAQIQDYHDIFVISSCIGQPTYTRINNRANIATSRRTSSADKFLAGMLRLFALNTKSSVDDLDNKNFSISEMFDALNTHETFVNTRCIIT